MPHGAFEHGRQVGRVVGLWRYPVKSMAGEELAEAEVSWHGLAGDRRWAFIRDGVVRSGFPWLTLRERGDMSHYRPSLVEPARPDKSPTVVRTPSGATFDVADPALAAELGPGVRVHQAGPRHLRHLAAVAHHDADDRPPRRDGRRAARGAALSTEHPGGGRRRGAVRRGRLGGLGAAHRRHAHAGRQARRPLRRHHHRSRRRRSATRRSCARSPATARVASASTARPWSRGASRWTIRC